MPLAVGSWRNATFLVYIRWREEEARWETIVRLELLCFCFPQRKRERVCVWKSCFKAICCSMEPRRWMKNMLMPPVKLVEEHQSTSKPQMAVHPGCAQSNTTQASCSLLHHLHTNGVQTLKTFTDCLQTSDITNNWKKNKSPCGKSDYCFWVNLLEEFQIHFEEGQKISMMVSLKVRTVI